MSFQKWQHAVPSCKQVCAWAALSTACAWLLTFASTTHAQEHSILEPVIRVAQRPANKPYQPQLPQRVPFNRYQVERPNSEKQKVTDHTVEQEIRTKGSKGRDELQVDFKGISKRLEKQFGTNPTGGAYTNRERDFEVAFAKEVAKEKRRLLERKRQREAQQQQESDAAEEMLKGFDNKNTPKKKRKLAPGIRIRSTSNPEPVSNNQTRLFFNVENFGTVDAQQVAAQFQLPPGTMITGVNPASAMILNGLVQVRYSEIKSGERMPVTITYAGTNAGEIVVNSRLDFQTLDRYASNEELRSPTDVAQNQLAVADRMPKVLENRQPINDAEELHGELQVVRPESLVTVPSSLATNQIAPEPAPSLLPGETRFPAMQDLGLIVDGPETATVGQRVKYVVTVKNMSATPIDDVEVVYNPDHKLTKGPKVVQLDSNPSQTIAQLKGGETKRLDFYLVASGTGTTKPKFSLAGSGGRSMLQTDTSNFNVGAEGQLSGRVGGQAEPPQPLTVIKRSIRTMITGPTLLYSGNEAHYQITVTNTTKSPANDLVVRMKLSTGMTVTVLDRDAHHSARRKTLTWELPTLAPGEKEVIQFKAMGTEYGEQVMAVKTGIGQTLQGEASMTTNIIGTHDIDVKLQRSDEPTVAGVDSKLYIKVTNTSIHSIDSTQVDLTLPDGVAVYPSDMYDVVGRVVMFQPFELKPNRGRQIELRFLGRVPGEKLFSVQASSSRSGDAVSSMATIDVANPTERYADEESLSPRR